MAPAFVSIQLVTVGTTKNSTKVANGSSAPNADMALKLMKETIQRLQSVQYAMEKE
jgi:hypothetical protein